MGWLYGGPMDIMGHFRSKAFNISSMDIRKSMAGDTKKSQKTLEQRGFATLAMTYPEEMGIIAVAKDMTERTGEVITPDMVAGLRSRLKAGSAYREALLQVERADLRFKLKTLAKDLADIFDQSSGESDFMRARAYAGHTLAGVYKQLYDHLGDEIKRVKEEESGEGEEQDADFTLVPEDDEPQPLPAAAPTAPAPVEPAAPASPAADATVQDPSTGADSASPFPAPVEPAVQDPDEKDTMNLLERVI